MIKSTQGEVIKRLRLKRGLSQEQLAEQLGVGQGYVSMLERGERGERLSLTMATKIARALGVSVEELAS